jgi:hypothetical protein
MSVALSPVLAHGAWPQFRRPSSTAKVSAAIAVVAGALGFAAIGLGEPPAPAPADHPIVTPAPHRVPGPGNRQLPVLQLPTVVPAGLRY